MTHRIRSARDAAGARPAPPRPAVAPTRTAKEVPGETTHAAPRRVEVGPNETDPSDALAPRGGGTVGRAGSAGDRRRAPAPAARVMVARVPELARTRLLLSIVAASNLIFIVSSTRLP